MLPPGNHQVLVLEGPQRSRAMLAQGQSADLSTQQHCFYQTQVTM